MPNARPLMPAYPYSPAFTRRCRLGMRVAAGLPLEGAGRVERCTKKEIGALEQDRNFAGLVEGLREHLALPELQRRQIIVELAFRELETAGELGDAKATAFLMRCTRPYRNFKGTLADLIRERLEAVAAQEEAEDEADGARRRQRSRSPSPKSRSPRRPHQRHSRRRRLEPDSPDEGSEPVRNDVPADSVQ